MQNSRAAGLVLVMTVVLMGAENSIGGTPLTEETATAFLESLLASPDSMDAFIDPDDLATAHRLGISYPEAPCKPLIAQDLSLATRERLLSGGMAGQFAIEKLDDEYSRLELFPADTTSTRSWIFRNGKVVSSILYKVRDWKQIDSPHFRFFVSDTTMFHPANIEALESFLIDTASQLGLTDVDLELLRKEKIYYCFCRNQEEIRELTGYFARGMYVVSHDLIVSTYSAHFHELAHLLMNFKLKQPHLYTHPFFLEGFAVAVGGRGGKTPDILHQMGLSILRSGWVSVEELLGAEDFYRVNASMSYPGSAVYNRFLMEKLSPPNYLELYARHGGEAQDLMSMRIGPDDLPGEEAWQEYLDDQPLEGNLTPGAPGMDTTLGPVTFHPLPGGTQFGFAVPETLLVFDGMPPAGYQSFLYEEFFSEAPYGGHRYFIRASSQEAAVYDLFTNTMLALYASGFSANPVEIPLGGDLYLFRVDRSAFPRPPTRE